MLLDKVLERGSLKVSISSLDKKDNGEFSGFHVDLSRAIAAAIFGDANKVEFVVENLDDSLNSVANAEVDLAATGVVSRASAGGEMQTGRLIYARLETARGFKPGDFVTVEVEEPPLADVVRLPASAIDANDRVLVLGEGDRLESVQVRLMRRQGDEVLVRGRDLIGRDVGIPTVVRFLKGIPASRFELIEATAQDIERIAQILVRPFSFLSE